MLLYMGHITQGGVLQHAVARMPTLQPNSAMRMSSEHCAWVHSLTRDPALAQSLHHLHYMLKLTCMAVRRRPEYSKPS